MGMPWPGIPFAVSARPKNDGRGGTGFTGRTGILGTYLHWPGHGHPYRRIILASMTDTLMWTLWLFLALVFHHMAILQSTLNHHRFGKNITIKQRVLTVKLAGLGPDRWEICII